MKYTPFLSLCFLAACSSTSDQARDTTQDATQDATHQDATHQDAAASPDGAVEDSTENADTTQTSGQENTNALCSDGISNDGDKYIDCVDYDCSRNPNVTVCGTSDRETDCRDGISNDSDSFVDCDDHDCDEDVACLYDGIDNLVTAPNVAGGCYSVAVFSRTLSIEGETFAADTPYPVVAMAGEGYYELYIRNSSTIDSVPVVGSAGSDRVVRIWVSEEVLEDANSAPPAEGTSTDLCWWSGTNWACPSSYLEGIRGSWSTNNAFVPQDWVPCKPYIYLPMLIRAGNGVGVEILAPVRGESK